MRVLVCGSRYFLDRERIFNVLKTMDDVDVIIHGGCRGADRIAGMCAQELGIEVKKYPADWRKYGKAAGPIRNQRMIDEGKPDIVVYFHDDLENSKGTKDMIERAKMNDIQVVRG